MDKIVVLNEEQDKIIIKNALFYCKLGVPAEEREQPQPIYVDVTIFRSLKEAAESDNIVDTINYASVHKHMKTICDLTFYTLEALAEKMATQIMLNFYFSKIIIQIRKPMAMKHKEVEYAAVEIERNYKYPKP